MSAVEQPQQPDETQLRHDTNLQQPFNEQGQLSAEYINELTSTDLDDPVIDQLQTLLTRDYVLAFFRDAEVEESKWLNRIKKDQVQAQFPSDDCVWTGEYRAYLKEDEQEHLEPLSDQHKTQLDLIIRAAFSRVTRSRDGWQQDKIGEQVKVSRVEEQNQSNDGGLLNLFS